MRFYDDRHGDRFIIADGDPKQDATLDDKQWLFTTHYNGAFEIMTTFKDVKTAMATFKIARQEAKVRAQAENKKLVTFYYPRIRLYTCMICYKDENPDSIEPISETPCVAMTPMKDCY